MTEPIERVAEAIYDRCNHWDYDDNLPPYSSLPNGAKAQWQDAAHHAIEAMRVPTEAMLTALNDMAQCIGYLPEGYQAMIDAALSPNQKE